jgi:hypothetical protein
MINVKHKRCNYKLCNKFPVYGKPGTTKVEYCKKHKKDDMIDIQNKRRCVYQNCDIRAYFGEPGTKYCHSHKNN